MTQKAVDGLVLSVMGTQRNN